MTKWIVRYVFASEEDGGCGHNSGRLHILESQKLRVGDTFPCWLCGVDREIRGVEGRSA